MTDAIIPSAVSMSPRQHGRLVNLIGDYRDLLAAVKSERPATPLLAELHDLAGCLIKLLDNYGVGPDCLIFAGQFGVFVTRDNLDRPTLHHAINPELSIVEDF